MIEQLVPLRLPPGLMKNGTRLQAMGRWYDGNLVRFFEKTIRPVAGGTQLMTQPAGATPATPSTISGYVSRALAWLHPSGLGQNVAIGSTGGLSVIQNRSQYGITPAAWNAGPLNSSLISGATTGQLGQTTSAPAANNTAQTWQFDNFGSYLVAIDSYNATIYIWQGDTSVVAAAAAGAPQARGIVVTPERFLVALGTNTDATIIQWAAQETYDQWTPSANNSAGSLHLASTGSVVTGRRGTTETLIWTTNDLHRLTYVGEPFIYGVQPVADNCGLIGPNAVAMDGNTAFWMSKSGFFMYDGAAHALDCEVYDAVFGDINLVQATKIWALARPEYGEVWWFYPDSASTNVTRYVVYNYREGHWTTGKLAWLAGAESRVAPYPIVIDAAGNVAEWGNSMTRPASWMPSGVSTTAFLSSGPIMLGDDQRFMGHTPQTVMQIQRIVPDDLTVGDVTASLDVSFLPDGSETTGGPYTLSAQTDVRLTGRYVRLGLTEARATDWRVGTVQLGVRAGGRR